MQKITDLTNALVCGNATFFIHFIELKFVIKFIEANGLKLKVQGTCSMLKVKLYLQLFII